jgi:sugar phosphate isomerase/epimerase
MDNRTDRRRFLHETAALIAGAAAGLTAGTALPPASAVEPVARQPGGRLKLSCAAYSLRKYLDLKAPKMTLDEFIDKCAAWGCDGCELTEYYFPKPITADHVSRLKRRAILAGLDITGTPIGNNFALPPGEARDAQVAAVKSWIDVSADLGSPAIRIFAGSAPRGVDEGTARKWVVEAIESCCEHAAKRGVFLAVENHGGVVARPEGLLEIVKAVRCEWVAVNLDTGNFHTDDPYADVERCAPYAVSCQVKTEMTPAAGPKADADLPRLVAILRKTSYRGYVTLEYEAAEEPIEAVPRHLAAMRKLLE